MVTSHGSGYSDGGAVEARTVGDAIRWTAGRFGQTDLAYGHGTDNPRDEAAYLVLAALGLPPQVPDTVLDTVLSPAEHARLSALVQRRIEQRIPTAYLVHAAWFCGLKFYVDERVLVPRSPIAELIERGFEPWWPSERPPGRLLDVGTGSGCIAIACAYAFPEARVDAVDVDEGALAVARRNVADHGLEGRVTVRRSDLFGAVARRRYEVIVANLPYVGAEELAGLPPEYRHEPRAALAGGADGLDLVVRLLAAAPEHLGAEGLVVVEVGNSEEALTRRFPQVPFLWPEFERGGGGVFLLDAAELREHHALFAAAAQTGPRP